MTGNNPNLDLANLNEFGEIHSFVLKTLSRNEILISIKGHNSVTRQVTIPTLILCIHVSKHIQNLVKFCLFVQKLFRNEILKEILTSVKGHSLLQMNKGISGPQRVKDTTESQLCVRVKVFLACMLFYFWLFNLICNMTSF